MILDKDFTIRTFFLVLQAIPITLKIVLIVLIVSIVGGFLVALGRIRGGILGKILAIYVSFIRGTPVMVQIYLLYRAIPTVLGNYFMKHNIHIDVYGISGMTYAYVIFSMCMIAFLSEMFRGGLNAIDKGQLEAAKAIGLSNFQGYRRIILPQAIVNCLPVLCTNVTGLVKMSSLAFALGVAEIMGVAKTQGAKYTCYLEAYLIIAILYVVINLLIELIFKLIEKRVSRYHKL